MNRYTAILAAVCLILIALLFRSYDRQRAGRSIIEGLQKSLKIEKDENGRNKTTINLLKASNKDLLKLNPAGDTMLGKLQAAVRKDRNIVAATVFKAITEGDASGKTDPVKSVFPVTTKAQKDSIKIVGVVKQKGFEATVEATADSIRLIKYKIESNYLISQTTESQGLFKPRRSIVQITPEDPNSSVIDARSYTVQERPRRTGWKIAGGFVLGVIATKLAKPK